MENNTSNVSKASASNETKIKRKKGFLVGLANVFFWICFIVFVSICLFTIDEKNEIGGSFGAFCLILLRIFFVIIPCVLTLGLIFLSKSFQKFRGYVLYAIERNHGIAGLDYSDYQDFLLFISIIVVVLSFISLIILLSYVRKNNEDVKRIYFAFILLLIVIIVFFLYEIVQYIEFKENQIIVI